MKSLITVETIQHTDVRGKDLLYIKIGEYLVNVGLKTWEAIRTEIIKNENTVPRETENKKQKTQ